MAEENLRNAEEAKKSQATDADSSLSAQEQARKSEEGGELSRPAEPQEKSDADAAVGTAEQDDKLTAGGETVRANEQDSKAGPDAESILQKQEAAEK